ncbi:retrotransposable element Tf2 [Tanacetum coccineum]
MKWLSLAEWWYNTNHHSFIDTTPFEIVYGQPPYVHIPYVGGESRVDAVDRTLIARETTIELLKFQLKRSQDRMKSHADRNKTDIQYELDDWVYLKLQPHRQVTIRKGKQHKLSPKYYGPFQIQENVGQVAYRLKLPASS